MFEPGKLDFFYSGNIVMALTAFDCQRNEARKLTFKSSLNQKLKELLVCLRILNYFLHFDFTGFNSTQDFAVSFLCD